MQKWRLWTDCTNKRRYNLVTFSLVSLFKREVEYGTGI